MQKRRNGHIPTFYRIYNKNEKNKHEILAALATRPQGLASCVQSWLLSASGSFWSEIEIFGIAVRHWLSKPEELKSSEEFTL